MEIVRKNSKKVEEQISAAQATVDQERIEKAQREFDTFNAVLTTKEYEVKLGNKEADYVLNEFIENLHWKGYESYAIKEMHDALMGIKTDSDKNGNFSLEGKVKPEIIEALFYFIKNYIGKGYKEAKLFKEVADALAIPMQEINNDRQTLRDLSLELIAAEQGVEVEKIKEQYQQQQ